MARADLLVELVRNAIIGNKPMIKKIAEAIISDRKSVV